MNKLIDQDSVRQFLIAYTYWRSDGLHFSKNLEWYADPKAIDPVIKSTALPEDFRRTKFIKSEKGMYLHVYVPTDEGVLQLTLDLHKLNAYFWAGNPGTRHILKYMMPMEYV
ncbi:hypothetical protein [Sphingobacterium sp. IITKGP-BTPF85]|uniref:hypothetical protein n=1 Tax=Sphingobacterium sp. IITKGP-BTPF85 TaxID=1338009 RepID=UPI00038A110B|nr:hypothetical protein [Sphingobacterium sp. IITKGP-BTPF85]KKX47890.1 hypothetical protein L950_0223975 [Sphingobacterium sp. IITKGP-BTPF85]